MEDLLDQPEALNELRQKLEQQEYELDGESFTIIDLDFAFAKRRNISDSEFELFARIKARIVTDAALTLKVRYPATLVVF